MINCVTHWMTDWLPNLQIDKLTYRLTDWLTYRLTDWSTDWLTDLQIDWLTYRLTDWLTDRLTDKESDLLCDSLNDWFIKITSLNFVAAKQANLNSKFASTNHLVSSLFYRHIYQQTLDITGNFYRVMLGA